MKFVFKSLLSKDGLSTENNFGLWITLDEKQLKVLAERGEFPIYLYWDNERNSLDFDVVKRSDAVGNIWKNPFVQPVISRDLSEQEICKKVNAVLEQELQVSQERFAPQVILTLDLGVDSLDMVEVIMALEKNFRNYDF